MRLLCLAVVSCFAAVAVPAQAGSPGSGGVAVGFARVSLADGTVAAFGGRGTKTVTTGPNTTGVIVFFSGKFPKNLASDQVVVQATAEAGDGGEFAVANALVVSATNSEIVVTVNGWIAGSETAYGGYVFLTVFAGTAPPLPK
ncbi:MAG: hypothetical protein ACHQ6T_04695 [Myxococcota bacterium]